MIKNELITKNSACSGILIKMTIDKITNLYLSVDERQYSNEIATYVKTNATYVKTSS